jgi:arginine-tRNA-protein transferase
VRVEEMLAAGWRRSGMNFYQNHCPGCGCCTPTRVPVRRFQPSRSQRRTLRRNADVDLFLTEPAADEETYDLYRRYVAARHRPAETAAGTDETMEHFGSFLVSSPLDTRAVHYRVDGRLVAVGWVDVLPDGLSSVYFAFDPQEKDRSLGVFSFMKEMDLARQMGKEWLYLGFYVPGSPKMQYKGNFHPREFAVDGAWTESEGSIRC